MAAGQFPYLLGTVRMVRRQAKVAKEAARGHTSSGKGYWAAKYKGIVDSLELRASVGHGVQSHPIKKGSNLKSLKLAVIIGGRE